MIIGPGVNIQSGVNMVVPQDQFFANETLLLSYGPNVAPAGDAQSFTQDASTNNFAVTINGDAKNETFSPFWPDGYWSNYFDGTSDYIDQSVNAAYGFGTGDFTVECWIYQTTTGTANGYYVWDFRTSGSSTAVRPVLFINSSNVLNYNVGTTTRITGPTLVARTWYHVAVVRATGTTTLYLNGVSQGTTTTSDDLGATARPVIGNVGDAPGSFNGSFAGYISNLRVVKGTAVYTSAFTAPTAPLSAITNTSLLTCQSNRFIDNSANNFTLTITGNTSVTVTEPFGFRLGTVTATVPNSSAITSGYSSTAFNGTSDYLTSPDSDNFDFGTGDFTIELWLRYNGTGSLQSWVSQYQNTTTGFSFRSSTANTQFAWGDTLIFDTSDAKQTNTWIHYAVSRQGTNLRVFKNGTQLGSTVTNSTNLSGSTSALFIGTINASVGWYFDGWISNVRIVKGVAVYTGNFTVPTAPLGLTQSAGTNINAITTGQTVFLLNGTTYGNNKNYIDSSANNFPITVTGNPSQTPISPYYGNNYSVFFDGSSNFSAAGSPAWRPGTADFTLECWVYHTTSGTTTVYFIDQTNGITFRKNSSDLLQISQDAVADLLSSSTTIPINQWAHVAVSRAGTTLRLFINGTQVGSLTNSTNFAGTGTLTIGATAVPNARMSGFISNMRMVNGTALYTANFTPPTAPLTAVSGTGLLFLQGTRFTDNSNYGTTFTRTGTPVISQFIPFTAPTYSAALYGGSMYCAATSDFVSFAPAGTDSFGTGDFTVECWLNPLAATAVNLSLPSANTNTWGFLTFSGQLYWQENGSNLGGGGFGSVIQQAWNHLAVCRSGTTIRWFVNGIQVNSATNSFNYSGAPATRNIGPGSGGSAPAIISNFRIVRGTALYTASFTPPTAPLTAVTNTSLLLNTNNVNTYDLTLSNPVTNVSGASQSTRQPFTVPTTQITYSGVSTFGSGYFDGTGDWLTLAPGAAFAFGTGNFTVELWVNFSNANSTGFYLIDARNSGQTGAWAFYRNSTNNHLSWFNGSTDTVTSSFTATNSWNHVAYTRSGTTGRLFFNGVQVGSAADSTNYSVSPTSSFIGTRFNGIELIQGYISNLRIVKGTAVYTANFTPPAFPASAIPTTSLLTVQQDGPANNSGFIDSGPNNLLVTRSGNTTQGSFTPYWPNGYWSNYFDGNGDYLRTTGTAMDINTFTISFYFYPTTSSVIGLFDSAPAQESTFRNWPANTIADQNGGSVSFTANVNQWNWMSIVGSGGTFTVHLNGVSVGSASYASLVVSNFTIGAINSGSAGSYAGYISNFRIKNVASVDPVPTSPLTVIAGTTFLTCQSNRFRDNSLNNFSIAATGETSVQRFQPFSPPAAYTPALYGASAYFDGTGDFLSPQSTPLFAFGTSAYTVEFWAYFPSYQNTDMRFFDAGSATNSFGVGINNSGWISIARYGSANVLNSPASFVLRQWNHVAVVRTSTATNATNIYVNGVSVVTGTDNNNWTVTTTPRISGISGFSFDFNGYLTDLRVVNGSALYTANFTPPTAPLQPVTNTVFLLPGNNAAIYDRTGTNDLETLGNAQTVTSVRRLGAGCMYFDGNGDYLTAPTSDAFRFPGDFTIEFWANPSSFAIIGVLFDTRSSGTSTTGISASFGTDGRLNYFADNATRITSSAAYSTGTWLYVTIVRSSGVTTMYVNGSSVGTYSAATNYSDGTFTIGTTIDNRAATTTLKYNGYLDNFQITKSARYTANFTTPVDNPIYR